MGTSPTNSGTSTPKSNKSNKMEKSASMVNLTEPELFGFFKNDSFVNLTKDLGGSLSNSNSDLDLSIGDDKDIASTIPGSSASTNIIASSSGTANAFQTLPFIVKLVILSSSAFIYNEIIKHINYNHFNENQLVNFPLSITHVFLYSFVSKFKVGNYFTDFNSSEVGLMVDAVFALTLQGLLMASFHPIMDRILPSFLSNRLLSSSPDSKTSSSSGGTNFLNDLIRTCITFLGISYAIRKIEWTSFLQVSIIWSLINPGLWLLLDGTISGFLSSLQFSGATSPASTVTTTAGAVIPSAEVGKTYGQVNKNNNGNNSKLLFGILYSLKTIATKLMQDADSELNELKQFTLGHYRVHFWESLTKFKFVIITDLQVSDLQLTLWQIYSNFFIKHVVENALSPIEFKWKEEGNGKVRENDFSGKINNTKFIEETDKYLQSLPMYL
ncbi:hypothetical protein KGF56_000564 [Candida oxycetoniae]|uniref:Uncharacterized protein n=1 Tax=Candida oxycetoniae TaxID=497107 RepID=A0AAI9T0Q6_9ASCO|nr:uncharacterized protein KGF56_000564 [Candida oxycetoniae]KAI3406718.2 hypothetical protein KGF56_000564 [Candida oxycetoniae]